MILEILTTAIMGGIAIKAGIKKHGFSTNDSGKLQRIMSLSGLNIREGKETISTVLIRKKQYDFGWEYVYRLPLGRSFDEYLAKQNVLEDGLNNRRQITFADLKTLQFDANIIDNLKVLWTKKLTEKKEIEISFDGLLKIRVYSEPLQKQIKWNENLLAPGTWSVPVGYMRNGEVICHDFDKSKHLIVAGATGYGKSVILKLIVTTLIQQQAVNTELSLFDMKGGSAFHRFKDCKQVKYYGRNPVDVAKMLEQVQKDMQKAFESVVDNGFEDVKEAKIKKRHFVVIDEAADLSENKEAMAIVTDIARRGRSAGYYLIFCTQYPTTQTIPSQTKRNIIARLCYVVDTDTASRVVLDEGGADQLPDIPGRGIYKNNVKRYIVQSPFISNDMIKKQIESHIVEKKEAIVLEKTEIEQPGGIDTIVIEAL